MKVARQEAPSREQVLLARLRDAPANFDTSRPLEADDSSEWRFDDHCVPLPSEGPGDPDPAGPWAVAARVARAYEFADPAIVRAVFDPEEPLEGRTMLLVGRFFGLRFPMGVRVCGVVDGDQQVDGRPVRLFGWSYRTLQGHLERGEMTYEIRKWLDSGEVDFRIHAFSQAGEIANPIVRIGFALFGRRVQRRFLRRALGRMQRLVRAELDDRGPMEDRWSNRRRS